MNTFQFTCLFIHLHIYSVLWASLQPPSSQSHFFPCFFFFLLKFFLNNVSRKKKKRLFLFYCDCASWRLGWDWMMALLKKQKNICNGSEIKMHCAKCWQYKWSKQTYCVAIDTCFFNISPFVPLIISLKVWNLNVTFLYRKTRLGILSTLNNSFYISN